MSRRFAFDAADQLAAATTASPDSEQKR